MQNEDENENPQAQGDMTPWPIALADFVRARLRAEVGPDHAPVSPDDPPLRVAAAFGEHLMDTQRVATMAEITDRTGITDPEVLSMGAWIWDMWVESIDLQGDDEVHS